jgi:hypothetical protein
MASKLSGALGAVVLTALCAGCAGIAPDQGEEKQEKVYRTGSNIPQRERAGSGVVSVDPSSVQDAVRARGGTGAGSLGR